MFSKNAVPAAKHRSTTDVFYSPVEQEWLNENSQADHLSPSVGLGTGMFTAVAAALTGGVVEINDFGYEWMGLVALPVLAVYGSISVLKTRWNSIKALTIKSLQEWLLEKHNIIISDKKQLKKLANLMVPRFERDAQTELNFTDNTGTEYILTKFTNSYRWTLKEKPKKKVLILNEKKINAISHKTTKTISQKSNRTQQFFWNKTLQENCKTLEKKLNLFANRTVTTEEQHVIERIHNDLADLLLMTEELNILATPTAEDVKALQRILTSLEVEVDTLNANAANDVRKALTVKENFIKERSSRKQQNLLSITDKVNT